MPALQILLREPQLTAPPAAPPLRSSWQEVGTARLGSGFIVLDLNIPLKEHQLTLDTTISILQRAPTPPVHRHRTRPKHPSEGASANGGHNDLRPPGGLPTQDSASVAIGPASSTPPKGHQSTLNSKGTTASASAASTSARMAAPASNSITIVPTLNIPPKGHQSQSPSAGAPLLKQCVFSPGSP